MNLSKMISTTNKACMVLVKEKGNLFSCSDTETLSKFLRGPDDLQNIHSILLDEHEIGGFLDAHFLSL